MALNPYFRLAGDAATQPLYLAFAREGALTIPT